MKTNYNHYPNIENHYDIPSEIERLQRAAQDPALSKVIASGVPGIDVEPKYCDEGDKALVIATDDLQ